MKISTRHARGALGAIGLATVAAMILAAPASAAAHRDRDHDGMPNNWEKAHHLNWRAANAQGDADHDGLSNLKEYTLRLDPRSDDSDDDGRVDGLEDADHDGIENADDSDEFCAAVTQSTNAAGLDDENDQGEDCDDQGSDDSGENESSDD